MKLKYLLMGALVGVAFTACTNDDEPAVNGKQNLDGAQYMSVKFVMSGDAASTRADGWSNENGFEAATNEEIAVKGATFLFFDGETQVADPFSTSDYDDGWDAVEQGSVDKEHEAIIVLKNAIKNPTSIVAILNNSGISVSRNTTMTQLMAITGDYRNEQSGKNFVMNNSVFVNGSKVQVGTPVSDDNICETTAEAIKHPVSIYVEKVVAKVTLANESNDTDTEVTTKPQGTETKGKAISVEVDRWWLDTTNPKSYLMKNLATEYKIGDVTLAATWWNDATNFRSYWATPYAIGTNGEHFELKDAKTLKEAIYAHENTDQANPTTLVVSATLKVDNEPADLVKFLSEVYTKADFNTLLYGIVAPAYFHRTETTNEGKTEYSFDPVPQSEFTFTYKTNTADDGNDTTTDDGDVQFGGAPIADYEAVVEMTYSGTKDVYTWTGADTDEGSKVSATDFANYLKTLARKVQFWAGGQTYYFIPINHNESVTLSETVGEGADAVTTTHPLYGIIRNHLYKVAIKSITGLGTPIANPTSGKVIIPEIPSDDESYIAAEIKILKYKVVTQNVDLGK